MKDIHIFPMFAGHDCHLRIEYYLESGAVALQLVSTCGCELIATATVNVPEISVPLGHALIKNWYENVGMLSVLTEAGVVQPTGATVPVGYCHAYVCRLLIGAPEHGGAQ